MASGWIPKRKGLSRTREVIAISARTKRTRQEVVGWLCEFWDLADDESADGRLPGMSLDMLVETLGPDLEFYLAMVEAGWLVQDEDGLVIPNFDHWLGQSAKNRLQNTKRKSLSRFSNCPDLKGTKARDTEQNRTEEKRREEPPNPPPGGIAPSIEEFVGTWNAASEFTACRDFTPARVRHFKARCKEHHFRRDWKEAIIRASKSDFCRGHNDRGWVATVDWFLRPGTVTKIMEGGNYGLGKDGERGRNGLGRSSRVSAPKGKYKGGEIACGETGPT